MAGPAIILLAAVVAVAPLFGRGPTCAPDFAFHFISWIDAEHSLSMGVLYPHWANSPNFGVGEPRFVFYPPISWMGGAVLGMILPWKFVRLAFFILSLAATGMASRALAKETLADGPATLAGCAAIFLGFPLFNVYRRCDFAELAAGSLLPLLLLFALRRRNRAGNFWEQTFDGSAAPLALVVAGIWLSNGPVGIMASYLLASVALVSALIEKSLVPVVRATVSTCAGMALASLYLIPAVWERSWASIQYAVTFAPFVVENNWLFARHVDPALASHDMFLHLVSQVAVAMLAIAFAGGAIAWIRGVVPGDRKWWLPLSLIPPAVLFLLLPVSQPVWNVLPELRLLQYPWRWLLVLEAPMAICFASAAWFDRRTLRIPIVAACAAVFVGISLATAHWWILQCGSAEASIQESIQKEIGVYGKPEYAPPGIRFPMVVDPSIPTACLLDNPPDASVPGEAGLAPAWDGKSASCNSSGWDNLVLLGDQSDSEGARNMPEQRWISGVAKHAGYLILRLRYYSAWTVKVNGIPVAARAEEERGLMAVPVPQGNALVSVDWTTTGDVVAGRWVTGIALLLITGMYIFERKLNMDRRGSFASPEGSKLPEVEPEHPRPSLPADSRNMPPGKLSKTARRKGTRKPTGGVGSR